MKVLSNSVLFLRYVSLPNRKMTLSLNSVYLLVLGYLVPSLNSFLNRLSHLARALFMIHTAALKPAVYSTILCKGFSSRSTLSLIKMIWFFSGGVSRNYLSALRKQTELLWSCGRHLPVQDGPRAMCRSLLGWILNWICGSVSVGKTLMVLNGGSKLWLENSVSQCYLLRHFKESTLSNTHKWMTPSKNKDVRRTLHSLLVAYFQEETSSIIWSMHSLPMRCVRRAGSFTQAGTANLDRKDRITRAPSIIYKCRLNPGAKIQFKRNN